MKPMGTVAPDTFEKIPIDVVCRRMTIKWEPIWNLVHRYLHCRCVVRLSTPSKLEKEMTLLVLHPCPRHNTDGLSFLDYGNKNYHEDSYFDSYGGYDSFRAMIFVYCRNIYQLLGSDKFLSEEEAGAALQALVQHEERKPGSIKNALREYSFDVNEHLRRDGVDLPEGVVQNLEQERQLRKIERERDKPEDFVFFPDGEVPRMDLSNAPFNLELREILDEKWSGRPHWALD